MDAGARLDAVRRLTWILAGVLAWGVCILWRLFSLQVLHHDRFLAMARRQQERVVQVRAPRGTVFDRNTTPMALSLPIDSVFVNPLRIPNFDVAAETLSEFLSLDRNELLERLQEAKRRKRGYLWIKRKISPEESERLKSLHCEWIEFSTESQRIYPGGPVAAHVLGSVYKEEQGEAGIEKRLDAELRGHSGKDRLMADVKHRAIESRDADPALDGKPMTLTIDERIQFIAERELKAQVIAKHARTGTVVVMNPYNGEILALANYPTFDPNKPPHKGDKSKVRDDLGVAVPFEPGSIYKVITLAAALETTNFRPETLIFCHNGLLRLPGRTIHEAHRGFGMLTFAQVLEKSSNIGAIEIGARVGAKRMYEYSQRFGIGQKTGIPLPAESPGRLHRLSKWGTTSLASVSIGQEVSATSIQLARVCSVIANGGWLVKPKLILKRGDEFQSTDAPTRVLKPETTTTMKRLMEGVVLRGTAKTTVKLDGYTAAGKTGTAQIFDVKANRYTHFYNASFMGFAPVTKPALVMVVTLNGTSGSDMGGIAAGPVFTKVMNEALRLLEVEKDVHDEPVEEEAAPADPDSANDLVIADRDTTVPNILDDEAEAAAEAAMPAAYAVAPVPAGPRVPNFRGKTMRAVLEEASATGLSVVIDGSGVARGQVPAPGSVLHQGDRIRVQFAR